MTARDWTNHYKQYKGQWVALGDDEQPSLRPLPYTRYSSSALRPVIRIGVKYRRRSLSYDVLVDSGADINVFNVELAEALGIDLAAGAEAQITGAIGQVETVSIHTLTLTVGAQTIRRRWPS
jgi:hypothetical protein